MVDVRYELKNFSTQLPNGLPSPSIGYHTVPLPRLAWAAATIGNTPFGPQPRRTGALEMQWRTAMLYDSLNSDLGYLRRSARYNLLDPSEKGAVSFFLGQAQAKLFAFEFFRVSLFVHYDSYLAHCGRPRRATRPDFIGFDGRDVAIGVEAKGRSKRVRPEVVARAKHQASKLPTINGYPTSSKYAHVAHFRGNEWCAHLEDPPHQEQADVPSVEPADLTWVYYDSIVSAIRARQPGQARLVDDASYLRAYFDDVDFYLSVHADIAEILSFDETPERDVTYKSGSTGSRLYERLLTLDSESIRERPLVGRGFNRFIGTDGVAIELGSSWNNWLRAG